MNKTYSRINWENYPSDKTPLNEQNLNKMDGSLDIIDDRVIVIDETKASKLEISTLFSDVTFDEATGTITFTRKNGSTVVIDTQMEKIALNIYYDQATEKLVVPLIDGTRYEVDLSRLITEFEFLDSDTIAFSVSAGKVTAIVKEGSIEEKHLRPDYLADIKIEVGKAEKSATDAASSEEKAKKSEEEAKKSETAAAGSATQAATSADNSAGSATAAANSASAAAGSASSAAASAADSTNSATDSANSADDAENSAIAAAVSESNAADSKDEAANQALLSKSWAIGEGVPDRENEETDNSKAYANQAKQYAEAAQQAASMVIPVFRIDFDTGCLMSDKQAEGIEFFIQDGDFYGRTVAA